MTAPELSLVLPAYNEAWRLPPYLAAIRAYASRTWGPGGYEVIVVDDGSTDGLIEQLGLWQKTWPELRLLRQDVNQGKGAAVRRGMLAARGRRWLLADADGATPIEEETRLRQALDGGADLAIGCRLGVQRQVQRRLTGLAFSALACRLFGLRVRDTQCGFKMFTAEAGRRLFLLVEEAGYLFDLELLWWAERLGCHLAEVPIRWHEMAGSKVRLLRDGGRMLLGLMRLWRKLSKLEKVVLSREWRRDGAATTWTGKHVRPRSAGAAAALLAVGPAATESR
jgi:dolichyl-phosphate beta-glucosyltransferase